MPPAHGDTHRIAELSVRTCVGARMLAGAVSSHSLRRKDVVTDLLSFCSAFAEERAAEHV